MIQIALISHGAFCEGLIDTLKMVSGDDFGVRTLSLVPGTAPDAYRESLSQILDELSAKDDRGVLVLTDIAGGTPFNSAVFIDRTGEVQGSFDKVHLWALERFYFRSGDEFPVFETEFGKVGII